MKVTQVTSPLQLKVLNLNDTQTRLGSTQECHEWHQVSRTQRSKARKTTRGTLLKSPPCELHSVCGTRSWVVKCGRILNPCIIIWWPQRLKGPEFKECFTSGNVVQMCPVPNGFLKKISTWGGINSHHDNLTDQRKFKRPGAVRAPLRYHFSG